jgi:hypothetical protein
VKAKPVPIPDPPKRKRGRPPKNPPPPPPPPPEPKSLAGRKSKLRPFQWDEIRKKHIVDKVPMSTLAGEYGVSGKAIGQQINSDAEKIRALAKEKIEWESKLSKLPIYSNGLVNMVADNLRTMALNMSNVGCRQSAVAARVSRLAELKTEQLDECAEPGTNRSVLMEIAEMTQVVNEASKVPLAILNGNKEQAAEAARAEKDITPVAIPDDSVDASKAYLKLIGG